jgi:dienelactone hydrolase
MARRCDIIVLFHSVLGLRPAIQDWAERLREEGHHVHTSDLYGDETVFKDMDDAVRHRDERISTLIGRAQAAVAELPEALVYMGFSMGASVAELLAATRPGAKGAVLMHGALPISEIDVERWPAGVPVSVHYMEGDSWVNGSDADQLGAAVREARAPFEVFTYPGSSHLFADRDSPDYDAEAAELMFGRVVEFLAHV